MLWPFDDCGLFCYAQLLSLWGYVPEFHICGGLFFELTDLLSLSNLSKTENLRQVHHGFPQVFSTALLIRPWSRACLQTWANIIFLLSGGHSRWNSSYQALCRKSSGVNGEDLAVPFVNRLFTNTLVKAREWQRVHRIVVTCETKQQFNSGKLISGFCQFRYFSHNASCL